MVSLLGCLGSGGVNAAAAFDPALYGTVLGWYDFSNNSKVLNGSLSPAADGDGIDTVTDSAASAKNARQTVSGSRPTYKTGIINSKNVARFNGSSGFLYLPSSRGITNNIGGFTAAIVYRLATTTGAKGLFEFQRGGGGTDRRIALDNLATTGQFEQLGRRLDADSSASRYGGSAAASTNYIVVASWDFTNALSWVYQNGTAMLASGAFGTAGNTSATNSTEDPTIGSFGLYGSTLFNGDIGEVVFWDSALSTVNRDAVEVALGAKWGIPVV